MSCEFQGGKKRGEGIESIRKTWTWGDSGWAVEVVEFCGDEIWKNSDKANLIEKMEQEDGDGFCENVLEQQLNFYVPSIFHMEHLDFEDMYTFLEPALIWRP